MAQKERKIRGTRKRRHLNKYSTSPVREIMQSATMGENIPQSAMKFGTHCIGTWVLMVLVPVLVLAVEHLDLIQVCLLRKTQRSCLHLL
jgi:hypothetical protein